MIRGKIDNYMTNKIRDNQKYENLYWRCMYRFCSISERMFKKFPWLKN